MTTKCPVHSCDNPLPEDAFVCPDCNLLMHRNDRSLLVRTRMAARRRLHDEEATKHLKEQYQSYLNAAVRKIEEVRAR